MIDTLNKLYHLLDRRGRRHFAVLVAAMLFDALLEIAALHLVPAYVGLVAYPEKLDGLLPPHLLAAPHAEIVLWSSLAITAFFTIKLLINSRVALARIRFAQKTALQLSGRLLNAYLHAPYEFHIRHNSAELQRNLNANCIQLAERVLLPVGDMLSQGMIMLAVLGVFVAYIPLPALALLIGILAIAGRVAHARHHRLRQEGQEVQRLQGTLIKTVSEALGSAKEILLLGRQTYFVERFHDTFSRLLKHQRHIQIVSGKWIPGGVELATIAALAAMISLLFWQGHGPQEILSFITIAAVGLARLKGSLSGFMGAQSLVHHHHAALDTIYDDLMALPSPAKTTSKEGQYIFQEEIQLVDVHYRYPDCDREVLRGIDLIIRKGESVGFVGKTGAGKSTLIDLIMGLLSPTEGEVLVDGRPLHERLAAWQHQIGYVPQMLSLIDGTIRENIALGVPAEAIDEAALQRAVEQAQLQELIERLPRGLDSVVGERGIRLSGGQRQRIAIARALYHEPEVIVLDEGTSALDRETEAEVIAAVERLHGSKTVLMIAHRLGTIQKCSRLYSVRNGTLTQITLADLHIQKPASPRTAP